MLRLFGLAQKESKLVASSSETVRPFRHQIREDAEDRVVYLCGPHGSGKSTLIEGLRTAKLGLDVRDQLGHMEALKDNLSRQVWRVALHAVEHRENLAAVQGQGTVVLGDRCCLDDEAYVDAFVSLGWMSAEERADLLKLTQATYSFLHIAPPKNFILLIPPIAWNIERILERWERGEETKWQETDFNYLVRVIDAYRQRASGFVDRRNPGGGRVLVIEETDAEKRIACVRRWLETNTIIQGRAWVEGRKRQSQTGYGDSS